MSYIPTFIARKHGKEIVTYDLPEMQEYLEETQGITIYQEQVMLISQKLSGFSKGDADGLRKAMGKKQKAILDKMKESFITGATAKGHPIDKLEKIWTDWEAFAQYAFNKSHSTCYAFVAYQTAYLKAHYPNEYMAAVLNHAGSIEKITFYMEECRRMKIKVLGPDINESQSGFAVNNKGEIRFGFSGLKGVGEAAIENIIEERKKNGIYKDIFDLVKRANLRTVNKKSLESLIYGGAFDCFKQMHRAQYLYANAGDISNLEKIIKFGSVIQQHNSNSSNTLFGDLELPPIEPPKLPNCNPWQLIEQLDYEKEVTGMFISGHPLDNYKFELTHYDIQPISRFNEIKNLIKEKPYTRPIRIAGLVIDAQHRVSKNGKKFGVLHIEDFYGKTEIMLWSEDYVRYQKYLEKGMIIMIEGAYKKFFNSEEYRYQLAKIHLLETIKITNTKQVKININPGFINDDFIAFMENNFKAHPGTTSILFNIKDPETGLNVNMHTLNMGFTMNDDLVQFFTENAYIDIHVVLN